MLGRAMAEVGVMAVESGAITSRVREYLRAINVDPGTTLPDWGSAFVTWVAIQSGITPPLNPGDPDSWAAWGAELRQPEPGAVIVATTGTYPLRRQAWVVVSALAGRIMVVGAHAGAVATLRIEQQRVVTARRPPNAIYLQAPAHQQAVDVRVVIEHEKRPSPLEDGLAVGGGNETGMGAASSETRAQTTTVPPPVIEAPQQMSRTVINIDEADVDQLRRSVVAALAAASESEPDDEDLQIALGEYAAIATAATSRTGILAAKDMAVRYMAESGAA